MASTPALAAFGEAPESGNTDATASATNTATTEADREISADHDDTDIMFAQMMIPHHQQAVEMSEMPLAKEGIPAQVVEFAQGVIDAQGPEIDRMNAMLGAWGPQPVPLGRITTLLLLQFAVLPVLAGSRRKSVHKFAKRVLWHLPATYRRNQAPG